MARPKKEEAKVSNETKPKVENKAPIKVDVNVSPSEVLKRQFKFLKTLKR